MTGLPFEMVDTLIFEGLLQLAQERGLPSFSETSVPGVRC
jgi:hypothetical protein